MELRNRKIPSAPDTPRSRRSRTSGVMGASAMSESSMATADTTATTTKETPGTPGNTKTSARTSTTKSTSAESVSKPGFLRRALAWSVHLYTGLGLLINAYSLHVALYGGAGGKPSFTLFARLNWLAILVDATDGTLARRFDVKHLARGLDGALLDNIIDFQTFALLPALAVIVFELVPGLRAQLAVASAILVASGFQFCQTTAKTDQAFVGFPSYWNIVLFYVYYLRPSVSVAFALFFGCALLSFVPIHFVYPTRTEAFFVINIAGAYVWGALMIVPTVFPGWKHSLLCMRASLLYVVYYFGVSIYLDAKRRSAERTPLIKSATSSQ